MPDVSNSLPHQLPGIQVGFALKQCLEQQDLLMTLPFFNNNTAEPILNLDDDEFAEVLDIIEHLRRDYKNTAGQLEEDATDFQNADQLLHDLQGAAVNLGLADLSSASQQLRDHLKQTGNLTDEARGRFHSELEKVGRSIKTLDSAIQS